MNTSIFSYVAARLDGVNRKRSTSFKEWLQLPEEKDRDLSWYTSKDADPSTDAAADASGLPKKKRVRTRTLATPLLRTILYSKVCSVGAGSMGRPGGEGGPAEDERNRCRRRPYGLEAYDGSVVRGKRSNSN